MSDERRDGEDAAVEAAEQRLVAAMEAGDPAAVVEGYTEDGVLLLPGRPPLAGRDAIREHFRSVFAGWEMTMESHTAEIAADGDLAALRGTVVQRAQRKAWPRLRVTVRLRHLLVLRRGPDGVWLVAWDTVQKAGPPAEGGGPLGFLKRVLGR